jgi:antitoxin HicB
MPNKLPRFEVRPLTAEEGGGYLVEFPEYPGCMADGATIEEALHEARDALKSYKATLKELGHDKTQFSGQWRQRVPRSLHAALTKRAQGEGVSLNMLVTALLADGLKQGFAGKLNDLAVTDKAGKRLSTLSTSRKIMMDEL